MDAFITSLAMVTLAEMGDKTQILSLMLVVTLKKPWSVLGGVTIATLINHALVAFIGKAAASTLPPEFHYLTAASFIIIGLWLLKPDKIDNDDKIPCSGRSALIISCVAFFLAEMLDKTQIATIMLSMQFPNYTWHVIAGTTIGMLAANTPVIFFGQELFARLPLKYARYFSATLFVMFGIWELVTILFK